MRIVKWWRRVDAKVAVRVFYGLLRPLLALVVWLAWLTPSVAATIRFEHESYTAVPGGTLVLRTTFDQPIPNGLEAYYLQMTYHPELFHLTPSDITVTPELDFDLFTPGAVRMVLEGETRVRGFAEMGAPYDGTDFIEFTVTIPPNAPAGSFTVSLSIPETNSFIDGMGQVIDGALVLEPTTVKVQVPMPKFYSKPVINPETGSLHGTYEEGVPGRHYQVLASTDLEDWAFLAYVTADAGGLIQFVDPDAPQFMRRFYRVVDNGNVP